MLQAMIDGETDAHRLAEQAQTHLKATAAQLEEALDGVVGAHQRFLLGTQLRHVAYLSEEIRRLDTIPGIGVQRVQEIIAAIGVDICIPRDYPNQSVSAADRDGRDRRSNPSALRPVPATCKCR